jgi:hypothetical protein
VAAPRPDRYADAVRARRAELRGRRVLLLGGHRAELRTCLAEGRLAASAALSTALSELHRELRDHANRADRAGRAALPAAAHEAVDQLAAHISSRFAAAVAPGVRRVATARDVPDVVGWPPVAARPPDPVVAVLLRRPAPIVLPRPDPAPHAIRALLVGAWRIALVPAAGLSVVGLPAAGLPALGGRAVLPLAVGVGLALLASAVGAQRAAADRARLRRWATEVVSAVRAAVETELARRVLELERVAGAELDEAVTRRRAALDAELQALTTDGGDRAAR